MVAIEASRLRDEHSGAPGDETGVEGMADHLLSFGADDAIAFVSGAARCTYGELRQAVATLTQRLVDEEWPSGTPVALIAPNGPFWIAAYIATMQAGLVTVPLPTVLTTDEAIARLRWVGARAAFVGGRAGRVLGDAVSPDVRVYTEEATIEQPVSWGDRPLGRVRLDDDAAYLFTSGTTGDPRAVVVTHGNIRTNTASILGYLDLTADDRVLVVLPFSYVFGASLLHTHLRVGATLVDQAAVAYPETTVRLLAEERCTVFAGVPSVFHTLLRNTSFSRAELPHLRIIQQAGGRLPPALLHELMKAHPQARVFVMYGQTEATARLSVLDPRLLLSKPGSIGRGIPGVRLAVIGDDGQPVAAGEIGEIYATGANVSRGYLRDPQATDRKMPGGVLHTGDLATVDEEGYIYVVDRAEDFIKSWGYRVASQEVEEIAMEVTDLVAAAAVGVPDDAAGERIALMVVMRAGALATPADILAHCRSRLPKYSVPAEVHVAERLPTNANGKIVKSDVRRIIRDVALGGHGDERNADG